MNGMRLLQEACESSPLVGLHAFKLFLEVWYADICLRSHCGEGIQPARPRHSHRSFPRGFNFCHGYCDFAKMVPSNTATDVLNESFTVAEHTLSACDLSVFLLSSMKDILVHRACISAGGDPEDNTQMVHKLPINEALLKDLETASAFVLFEQDVCKLQKVSLDELEDKDKLLFFTNVHNVLMSKCDPMSHVIACFANLFFSPRHYPSPLSQQLRPEVLAGCSVQYCWQGLLPHGHPAGCTSYFLLTKSDQLFQK